MPKAKKDKAVPRTLAVRRVEFLAEEGYRPEYEPDADDDQFGVITFKCEGSCFLLFVYEDDPDYFNLGMAYDLGQADLDPAALANVAGEVNASVKGVKCTLALQERSVRFQVESFLGDAKPTAALLRRSVDALRHGAAQFFQKRVPTEHLDA
jgi:putative sensory transduction regulator